MFDLILGRMDDGWGDRQNDRLALSRDSDQTLRDLRVVVCLSAICNRVVEPSPRER